MALSPGDKLGPYEVVSLLGKGGMGEVYRAHDPKLNRDIAIKVLPHALAHDADYLARFQREAQTLASLNHPNIAAIYGLEGNAIVMEMVEGETLKGPLPLAEALAMAKQIAEALEAAHDKNAAKIGHRPGVDPTNWQRQSANLICSQSRSRLGERPRLALAKGPIQRADGGDHGDAGPFYVPDKIKRWPVALGRR